jgi:hypothetical protein
MCPALIFNWLCKQYCFFSSQNMPMNFNKSYLGEAFTVFSVMFQRMLEYLVLFSLFHPGSFVEFTVTKHAHYTDGKIH